MSNDLQNNQNNVEEIKSNPEFYSELIINLRNQVATNTLMNIELQTLVKLYETEISKLNEEIVKLKNGNSDGK